MKHDGFIFIAGPCVIEDETMTLNIARRLKELSADYDVDFVFKASFDKANRTSVKSYRGPGIEEGLRILKMVRESLAVPVLTDIHTPDQAAAVAAVADILQIPAFLCRQTDLLVEAGRTGRTVNIKKAQFMAPEDMAYAVKKVESTGNKDIVLTERGSCLGYHNLVVDFRSFSVMSWFGYPVVFDATHSVQIPSQGGVSSGKREYVRPLARAAAAYGVNGLFCEVHPRPDEALSDAANSIDFETARAILDDVSMIRKTLESGNR
jgi:2-dehydro-3-deoxyphosphooctonate aldolase (KDO 8-P synthase)